MRLSKLVTLGFTIAALATAGATADPGKGKPDHSARACRGKAKVMVVLKGTFVAAAADGTSFQLDAQHANRHGRPYVESTQPLTVNVDAATRYEKSGQDAKLSDLAANDPVVVMSRLSRCDLNSASASSTLPALTARRVVVQGPESAQSSEPTEK
jgi:hypothetical protein